MRSTDRPTNRRAPSQSPPTQRDEITEPRKIDPNSLPANIPAVSEVALLQGVLEVTAEKIDEIAAKIVVLGVQKANEGGVDGQLLGQLDGAGGEDLEDVLLVVGQIGFQHGGQTFQIALQTRRAFLPDAADQRL